ncbi:MAG: hypothetical protein IRZ10_06380 [Thermoflavifilum sp.]|nr:hypothetical protein [Thermoflavifilum sp.]MCL6514032.1 hypothetical protein [Alicyclobacillus sp.]
MTIRVSDYGHEVLLRNRIESVAVPIVGVAGGFCAHRLPVAPTTGVCLTLIWFLLRGLLERGATVIEVVWSSVLASNAFVWAWLGRAVTPLQAVCVTAAASLAGVVLGCLTVAFPVRQTAGTHGDVTNTDALPASRHGVPAGPDGNPEGSSIHVSEDQPSTNEHKQHRDSPQDASVLGHEV